MNTLTVPFVTRPHPALPARPTQIPLSPPLAAQTAPPPLAALTAGPAPASGAASGDDYAQGLADALDRLQRAAPRSTPELGENLMAQALVRLAQRNTRPGGADPLGWGAAGGWDPNALPQALKPTQAAPQLPLAYPASGYGGAY